MTISPNSQIVTARATFFRPISERAGCLTISDLVREIDAQHNTTISHRRFGCTFSGSIAAKFPTLRTLEGVTPPSVADPLALLSLAWTGPPDLCDR